VCSHPNHDVFRSDLCVAVSVFDSGRWVVVRWRRVCRYSAGSQYVPHAQARAQTTNTRTYTHTQACLCYCRVRRSSVQLQWSVGFDAHCYLRLHLPPLGPSNRPTAHRQKERSKGLFMLRVRCYDRSFFSLSQCMKLSNNVRVCASALCFPSACRFSEWHLLSLASDILLSVSPSRHSLGARLTARPT
jgi:hypothetical protein